MRVTHDERSRQDAAANQLLHEQSAELLRSILCRIRRYMYQRAWRTNDLNVLTEPMAIDALLHTVLKPTSLSVECLDDRLVFICLHRGNRGGQRVCLGAVRCRQEENALFVVVHAAALHQVALAG